MYVCIYFAIPSVSSKVKFVGYKWFSLSSPQHNQTDLLKFCYSADNFFFSLKENLGVYLCHHFHRKSFSPWRRQKWKSDGNSWRGSYRSVRSKERFIQICKIQGMFIEIGNIRERFIHIGKIRERFIQIDKIREVHTDW